MERYLTGSFQPPAKKRKEDYETSRTRSFQPTWKQKFRWLDHVTVNRIGKMVCGVCRKYETTGTFVTGCTNMRIETIRIHDKSASHVSCMAREQAKLAKPGTTPAEKSLLSLNKAVFERLSILFRTAHALAKHGRPYSDFRWVLDLHSSIGVDIGTTYRNDKRAKDFIHSIACNERLGIGNIISSAKYMSVISDGATDSSHSEAEICYVRTAVAGKVSVKFVGIQNIGKPDSRTIEATLNSLLSDAFGSEWGDKVVGIGTDGANVMVGKVGGVVKRMKDRLERPFILGIHCSAHRLELAYKDGCKDVKLYKRVNGLLLNLYLFYRNSPLNRYNLKQAYLAFNIPMLMPSRVGGTRWLPHTHRALTTVLSGYAAIVNQLTQLTNPDDSAAKRKDSSAKAKNFLGLLRNRSVVAFLHFMWDVTEVLSRVSKVFQDRTSTVADVNKEIEVAKDILTTYSEKNGPKLASVIDKDSFEGFALTGNLSSFKSARRNMTTKLTHSLVDRFEVDSRVLKATCIVSLPLWPLRLSEDPAFGNSSIDVLADQFGPALVKAGFDAAGLPEDWLSFKRLVYDSYDSVPTLSWQRINSGLGERCPLVLSLIDLILSLPASSAEAERGFSLMKKTKTDWRSRLSSSNLSDLMMVSLESLEIGTFDPEPAIHLWYQKTRFPDRSLPSSSLPASQELEQTAASVSVSESVANTEGESGFESCTGHSEDIPEDFIEEDFYSEDEVDDYDLKTQESKAYALFQQDMLSCSCD